MQRDLVHFTTTKLQGGWSASDFSKYLTKDSLRALLPKFDKFEPLVRVRILLSLLTLDKETKRALHEELQSFITAAREDKEEWVSITAKALGNLALPLDFPGMLSGSAIVRNTVNDLETRLADGDDTAYRPLEEAYLHTSIVEEERGAAAIPLSHSHFTPRGGHSVNPPELYSKAKASAASAISRNPSISNASSPLHPLSNPNMEAEARRDSTSHAAQASEASTRQAGVEDMFRSNRQQSSIAASRHAPSSSVQERRGAARPVQVKLLDVTEVQKLNDQEVKKKQPHLPSSPEGSNAQTQTRAGPSLETEAGELEAGELCDDSYSEPAIKRMRVAHEGIV